MSITIGSLFAGLGGLERGVELATGGRTVWQAEIDPYCTQVLQRHWPHARRYSDVRQIDKDAAAVSILCGGFPCQDISGAGQRRGIDGPRSGLWGEFARIIRELRPSIVFVENVSVLTRRGLDRVLGDLAGCGFDAEWSCLRASDVGAPHLRRRVFILATPRGLPDAHGDTVRLVGERTRQQQREPRAPVAAVDGGDLAHGDGDGLQGLAAPRLHDHGCQGDDAHGRDAYPPQPGDGEGWARWEAAAGPKPGVCRGADGVPDRLVRLTALGNAVVPGQAMTAFVELLERALA